MKELQLHQRMWMSLRNKRLSEKKNQDDTFFMKCHIQIDKTKKARELQTQNL